MATVYIVNWDNGQQYEDHRHDIGTVFTSRVLAEELIAKLIANQAKAIADHCAATANGEEDYSYDYAIETYSWYITEHPLMDHIAPFEGEEDN